MSLFSNLGTLLRMYTVQFKVKGTTATSGTFGTTSANATSLCQVYMKKLNGNFNMPERPKGISASAERVRLYFVPTSSQTLPLLLPNTEATIVSTTVDGGKTSSVANGKLMLDQLHQSASPLAESLVGNTVEAWYWQ